MMTSRAQRIMKMVIAPIKDPRENQSQRITEPSENYASDIQTDTIINYEYDPDDTNSIPDSQLSLDILNSDVDYEDRQAVPPKLHLIIQETDSDSDSTSDESTSFSGSSTSSSSSCSSSRNTRKDFLSDNFFDLKPLCTGNYNTDDNGNKLKWTHLKILKVDKLSNGMFFFKTSYEEVEFRPVTTVRKRRTKSNVPDNNLTLNKLYTEKLTVPEAKKPGILKLIEKT